MVLPYVPAWADPAWHLYVVRNLNRDALQKKLADAGVGTLIHYPIPPHLQGAYADLKFTKGSFPISEQIHNEVLSLPISPGMTVSQADQVVLACHNLHW
jgi:dTDP-4-amino-4,6-dideoxygalactose transaminase